MPDIQVFVTSQSLTVQVRPVTIAVTVTGGGSDVGAWLNNRPPFQSNGDALAAFELIYGTGNAIGKTYWAAHGNVEVNEGIFMRVVAE